ncbi:MAG TPA: TonB-dependent receptor plug domain-containing protein, partial [Steroidobacteraceae bacterium]|nr:TonB-dependent receptor plug domain-containing protein [Steroidobacteraceae bacterium]
MSHQDNSNRSGVTHGRSAGVGPLAAQRGNQRRIAAPASTPAGRHAAVFASATICCAMAAGTAAGADLPDTQGPGALREGVPASATQSSGALEEVVVTARRREENMQTVPIAITAVTEETLQANNVQTFGELQYLVPSMSVGSATTRDAVNVTIRGQGLNSSNGLPGVIAYINEVPIPTDADSYLVGGPGLLFDLENVQVLKGPQGTLFGRNSVGGALLLQTARPGNDFGGRLQVGFGNYNERDIDGAIDIPIVSDTLLARIAVNGQVRDGFTHILTDPSHPGGVDEDNRDYWSTRGTVTFHPNEAFQNDTIVTFQTYTSHGSPFILTAVNPTGTVATLFPTLPALLQQQQALGPRTSVGTYSVNQSSGNLLAVNNISRVELGGDLTFRNILGYNEGKQTVAVDADGTPLPILETPSGPRRRTVRQFSEEAQVLGKSFAAKLDWIAGVFFLTDRQLPSAAYDVIFGGPADSEAWSKDRSKAVFTQGTYDLSAWLHGLRFTAGARYTWDDRFFDGGPVGGPYNETGQSDRAPTWTAGLDWQVAPRTMLYLTSRRGYRAGGSNGVDTTGKHAFPDFNPEFVVDFELGVKSDFDVGGIPLRTNADVYFQRYTDVQVQQFTTSIGSAITQNAAAAHLWGGELEAIAQLTRDLQLGANYSYLK